MKKIIPFLFLLLAAPLFSQTSIAKGVTVGGIGLGATYREVIRKFGKPLSEKKRKADECVGGTQMTLSYPVLKFRLWDEPADPKKFSVGFFEVTSAKWNVSGLRIGQTSSAIKKLLGTRSSEEINPNTRLRVWYYEMDDEKGPGNTNVSFRSGKVVSIMSIWDMC